MNAVETNTFSSTSPSQSESEREQHAAHPRNKREFYEVDQEDETGSEKGKYKRKKKHSGFDSSSSYEGDKKSKHKKKHKKHKHKKKHSHDKESTNKEELKKPNTIWIEESGLAPEKAFRVHKKPDHENSMYGGLYRLHIANYRLKPNLSCLGLKKNQSVKLTERKKSKKKGKEKLRYWNNQELHSTSFVHLAYDTKTKAFEESDNDSYLLLELPHNVSKDSANEKEIAEETQNTSQGGNAQENEIVQRTGEFNKLLRENPQDIATWLAFAKFQEESIHNAAGSTFIESENEKRRKASRVVTEKKIAVFERALEHNSSSVELIVSHLELCSEIWETEKLVQRWKKVVFTHPNKTLLWKHYLLFLQSHYSAFSFPKAFGAYHKCLTTLSSIKEGTFTSHLAEGDIEGDMLELFVQMCQFLKQSGIPFIHFPVCLFVCLFVCLLLFFKQYLFLTFVRKA